MRYWEKHGGSWCTSWVKGHVDDSDKPVEEYTLAEAGNISADGIATEAMTSQEPGQRLSVGECWWGHSPGGVWGGKVCSGSGGWEVWCDRTEEEVEVHAAAHNLNIYWRKRVSRRGGGGGGVRK